MADVPGVTILVLGDPGCGKSTFLSQLPRAQDKGDHALSPYLPQDPAQALHFNVSLYDRLYNFNIYNSGNSMNITPGIPEPDFVIICYDISNRGSLHSARHHWRKIVTMKYSDPADRLPVMLLGLKRDLRNSSKDFVHPHEAFGEAQQMRCDKYAECSAETGELMWEVLEDITKTAARTTTENGSRSQDSCEVI